MAWTKVTAPFHDPDDHSIKEVEDNLIAYKTRYWTIALSDTAWFISLSKMSTDSSSLSAQVSKLGLNAEQEDQDIAPSELVAVVDDLLNQLGPKFSNLSSDMITKMDEMSRRLDALEATIQAGNAATDSSTEK